MTKTILLVAGGTGGHLFPALALREALMGRGWAVHVASDARVGRFVEGVPAEETHVVRAATITKSPVRAAAALVELGLGLVEARRLLKRLRPAAVVGFGGYPTVPPLIAARLAGIPAIAHDANSVLGRANRLLLRCGARLATSFPHPAGAERARAATLVGNPVRAAVLQAAAGDYRAPQPDGPFRLLVFGGSQGAQVFSDQLPAAVARLEPEQRRRLRIVQQCRPEDLERTRDAYVEIGVEAELAPFFADLPRRVADAHLVISRSGASTVAELAVLGRPAILVPYPHALDQDQAANAAALGAVAGGWMMPQSELTPKRLAERLGGLMKTPNELARVAAAAKKMGRPDAVERLADLVEEEAAGRPPEGRGSA
ncbi:MAG TPA: undecaprenyldiphospho-muramoylpentapeptide beta-N-acetylglucosaminyltransferase [Afifellaceae bacterium]|nr:undecaprenyldiphospho-muramoylpentapeptide beta-N-acetylglucosaminyltransferase [Afifellaceae bacterium]